MVTRKIQFLVVLAILSITVQTSAQDQNPIRLFRKSNEARLLKDYFGFLAIPNVASDHENIVKNAEWIMNALSTRGLQPIMLLASDAAAPPVVFAEWKQPGATRTILLYAHYDGQPVTPKDWTVTDPWHPILRLPDGTKLNAVPDSAIDPEARIYGRSSSDDKAGVFGLLTAIEALYATKLPVSTNLKFLFEGEEEVGSSHLGEIIRTNLQRLKSDVWVICDGPTHPTGRTQVSFGVRGDGNVDVTVYGPMRPLHSGHYGNWAPNPAMRLAQLLASMKDAN